MVEHPLLKRRVALDGNDESTSAVNESAVHSIEIKKLLSLGRKGSSAKFVPGFMQS